MRRMLSLAIVAAIASLIVVPVAAGWAWPVDGPVLRPFSLAENEYAAGQHRGLDIGAAVGDLVRSPVAGTVSFAGSIPAGGRALTIQTADGYAVTLLQLGSIAVARGDAVAEGAIVGAVGASEDAVTSAPHVHLGVRVAAEPNGYVDPLRLLPARAAPSPPAPPCWPSRRRPPQQSCLWLRPSRAPPRLRRLLRSRRPPSQSRTWPRPWPTRPPSRSRPSLLGADRRRAPSRPARRRRALSRRRRRNR